MYMKKILFFLLLTCNVSLITLQAQTFELTPSGFEHQGKDYLILEQEGTAAELYGQTLTYLHTLYDNPKKALSTLEGQMITVTGYAPNSIHRNGLHVFDMNYTLIFRFKDNKVRIDAPKFTLTTFTSQRQTLHTSWTKGSFTGANLGIYGKKDKLKSKRAKADLEHYFNALMAHYTENLNTENDW